MRTTRIVFLAGFCLPSALASASAAAQSSPLVPGRATAAVGAGFGSATLSCSSCSSRRESSIAGLIRAGVAVSQRFALGVEATGWSKDFGNPTSDATERTWFADLVAQWYPVQTAGFFVKGGGGIAAIREDITTTGLPQTRIDANSSDLVAGLGWDYPVARQLWVTPYADFHHAPQRNAKVNGAASGERLGVNLVHIGIAATWR
jgi:hypothetical protein